MSNIKRGDSYKLPIQLTVGNDDIDISTVEMIEFTIGDIVKTYPEEVEYEDGMFLFPLSQEETFSFNVTINCEARIKYVTGAVKGTPIQKYTIEAALSEEVL